MQIGGATSILAQISPNFGQGTLEAMSEGGLKGKVIRQLDRNSGHSNVEKEMQQGVVQFHVISFESIIQGFQQ